MTTITLGGQSFEIAPLPFGRLRAVVSAFNKMNRASEDEHMSNAGEIIALVLDKPNDEVDLMPISIQEVAAFVTQIPELLGLVQSSGEATVATDGTRSTAI